MKKKDVIGIDVSKLTIDTYIHLAQVHAVFSNWTIRFENTGHSGNLKPPKTGFKSLVSSLL